MGVTLCDQQDIVDRLGRPLSASEITAWPGKAKESSVLIEGYLGKVWDDLNDVPDYVRIVCSRMVRRVFNSVGTSGAPSGMAPNARSFNATMGPMGHSLTFGNDVEYGDVWLSKSDKLMLRKPVGVVHNEPMFKATGCADGYDFQ